MLLSGLWICYPPLKHIDLNGDTARQIIVDQEKGQYLGHPTTVLLGDQKTILAVYPKGHGKGAILMKRSPDGGRTWGERLPTPASWATSQETPTIHRFLNRKTRNHRLILWSGLHPARFSLSDNEGQTWSELHPAGLWGGIVVMSALEQMSNGDLVALFHDDGRFFLPDPQPTGVFTLYQTRSTDNGETWSFPSPIYQSASMHLCEPGLIKSPDGKSMAILLRENRRQYHSQIMFSQDGCRTWSLPRALPKVLTGDRHTARYAPDGRLLISYRDMPSQGQWKGDWVAWVGTWHDLVNGHEGQYKLRLKDNQDSWDCGYPGVEILQDGTFVLTTYGHWVANEEPYILSVRLKLDELDRGKTPQ